MIRLTLTLTEPPSLGGRARASALQVLFLTADQIKAVVSVPVNPGQSGGAKDAPDCTWKDAKRRGPGLSQRSPTRPLQRHPRPQMQNTGRLAIFAVWARTPSTVSSAAGSTAYLYTMGKHHLLLLPGQRSQRQPPGQRSRRKGACQRDPPKTLSDAIQLLSRQIRVYDKAPS